MTAIVSLVGRILLGSYFFFSGVAKIASFTTSVRHFENLGIPLAPFFLFLGILCEVAGSLLLMTGFRAKWGVIALAAFLFFTTWLSYGTQIFSANAAHLRGQALYGFLTHVSMMGGLLMVYAHGPGSIRLGRD